MKYLYIVCFLTPLLLYSQQSASLASAQKNTLFADAAVFNGINSTHADVFGIIPYQTLQFDKIGNKFKAEIFVSIRIKSKEMNLVKEESFTKNIFADSYEQSRGSTAGYEYFSRQIDVQPGDYIVDIVVIDNNSKIELKKSRSISVLDYNKYAFSMSGAMLLSSIEQKNNGFSITPYLSDNTAPLTDGFFVFFETYNREKLDSVDFIVQWIGSKSTVAFTAERVRKSVAESVKQQYLRIIPPKLQADSYVLRIYAVLPHSPDQTEITDFLAMTERTATIEKTAALLVSSDVQLAVRQLRYIAAQAEIDEIQSGADDEQKMERFEEFWLRKDPTPNTAFNEAFEDYFARVEYANQKFKSYSDGWLTDKGMLYIIFGPPSFVDRQPRRADGRTIERWQYAAMNREFVFVDNSGFDDFRLATPLSPTEKYRYSR